MHAAPFLDRAEAARRLAAALSAYRGEHPLVLAIPRGGVPIGRVVADALGGDLDVVLVRKLGAPFNPEFAIGAVDESGAVHVSERAREAYADAAFIERESARELELIRERRRRYSPQRAPIDPAGRTVIVVDDGLATGATMQAALASLRQRHPGRLICAVPVAAPQSLDAMAQLCDETVCVVAPQDFRAVGQFYENFPPVSEDEVLALLAVPAASAASAAALRAGAPAGHAPRVLHVRVPAGGVVLEGDLEMPDGARGLVVFAHGSGSGRHSPRNRSVARVLNARGLATLLCDLLDEREDGDRAARFDIALLAARVEALLAWASHAEAVEGLPIGLFGASTGAAAALLAAARKPEAVAAVVSRGGRPDLAGRTALAATRAPTLLIVGGADTQVLELNRAAQALMPEGTSLAVVPRATHLFEEPGALEQVAELAARWFERHLGARAAPPSRASGAQ
jgi:predicted phosphoribosyltransferase/dienelactone hydrolase